MSNNILSTKICIKCEKSKPLDAFMTRENLASGKSSYRTECKECTYEITVVQFVKKQSHN
jgi:hypothetical protein